MSPTREPRVDSLPLTPEQRQRLSDLRSDYVALATSSGLSGHLPTRHDLDRVRAFASLSRFCDSLQVTHRPE